MHLGQMLRAKYVDEEQLLHPDHPRAAECVRAVTSNSHRTLQSASSLLMGMFPEMAQRFELDDEERKQKLNVQSICIQVASREYTPLLHGFKNCPAYDTLLKAVKK